MPSDLEMPAQAGFFLSATLGGLLVFALASAL